MATLCDWEEQERREQKEKKKRNWVTRSGFNTIILVNLLLEGNLPDSKKKF